MAINILSATTVAETSSPGVSNFADIAAKFTPPPMHEPVIIADIFSKWGIYSFNAKNAMIAPATVPIELIKNITRSQPLSFHIFNIFERNNSNGIASGTTYVQTVS